MAVIRLGLTALMDCQFDLRAQSPPHPAALSFYSCQGPFTISLIFLNAAFILLTPMHPSFLLTDLERGSFNNMPV